MSHSLHLTRFPAGLITETRRRTRRGGYSPRRIAWDIRHPLVVPLALLFTLAAGAVLLAWALVLASGWAVWTLCATTGWACSRPFRRHRQSHVPPADGTPAAEQWSRQEIRVGDRAAE